MLGCTIDINTSISKIGNLVDSHYAVMTYVDNTCTLNKVQYHEKDKTNFLIKICNKTLDSMSFVGPLISCKLKIERTGSTLPNIVFKQRKTEEVGQLSREFLDQ